MSLFGKILIVIQAVLALLFLGVQGTLYQHANNWRAAYETQGKKYSKIVEGKVSEVRGLSSKVRDLENNVKTAEFETEKHKDEIKDFEAKNSDLVREKSDVRSDLESLQAAHKTVTSTISEKDSQIKEYLSRIGSLEDSLKVSTSEQELAQAQVARLLSQRTALEKDLGEVRRDYVKSKQQALDRQLVLEELERSGVPVGTIVANYAAVPPIRGLVSGVDTSTEPALVLLSVGSQDGVKRGYHFTVYRNDKFVGKVAVSRLMADSVGCRVLFTAPGETVQQGDQAATRLD